MHFKPSLIPTLAALITIALMMKLGFWQLQRAHEKELSNQTQQDQPAQIVGNFLSSPIILHDNRIDQIQGQNQVGYHLLALFKPKNNEKILLVNLGWQPWPNFNRQFRPTLQLPTQEQALMGVLHHPIQGVFHLGRSIEQITPSFILTETLELKELSHTLKTPLMPVILQLNPNASPFAQNFRRNWIKNEQIGMTPEKHRGYAWQWFIMAAVVLGLYIKLNLKKRTP